MGRANKKDEDEKYDNIRVYHKRGLVDRAEGRVRKVRAHEETQNEKWARCVKEGKLLVMKRNHARLRIVDLALEACEIVRGGGEHWNDFKNIYNAKKFAAEIGIHHKTLLNWIGIKRAIYDHIDQKHHKNFNWTAAERARRNLPKTVKSLKDLDLTKYYESEINKPKNEKLEFLLGRYISNLRANIPKCNQVNLKAIQKELGVVLDEINNLIKQKA